MVCGRGAVGIGKVKAGIIGPGLPRSAVLADEFQHDRTDVLMPGAA